jgi:hypothetical protein
MNAGEAFQRLFRDLLAMRNHIAATLEIMRMRWRNSVRRRRHSSDRSGW